MPFLYVPLIDFEDNPVSRLKWIWMVHRCKNKTPDKNTEPNSVVWMNRCFYIKCFIWNLLLYIKFSNESKICHDGLSRRLCTCRRATSSTCCEPALGMALKSCTQVLPCWIVPKVLEFWSFYCIEGVSVSSQVFSWIIKTFFRVEPNTWDMSCVLLFRTVIYRPENETYLWQLSK